MNTTPIPTCTLVDGEPDDGLRRQRLLNAQAKRISILQEEITSRQEEVERLKAQILDSHAPGTYQAGGLKVTVKPGNRRVDTARFMKTYPADKYPNAYQLKPKPLSQLERLLTADAVAAYAVSSKPTVVVS
ncbi:hypothetical protein [Bifidobacterium sp. SO4]|uniref:hypothetical protein n=1 Tax=Bifidobacterium sp. SO4 TaxID=2809030 RepID=UPI001BDC4126|nr:hypothetical protein [Bifidobacterium sp. SO4]MBT1171718.1 hypothetical protein [Bifidobacterium sp. SO4]